MVKNMKWMIFVWFCVVNSSLGQPITGPEHRTLCEQLQSEAMQLIEFPPDTRVYLSRVFEGSFDWDIGIHSDASSYLDALGIQPTDNRMEQFAAWSSGINDQLYALTLEHVTPIDRHFNPVTDYELNFRGRALPPNDRIQGNPESDEPDNGYVSIKFVGPEMRKKYRQGQTITVPLSDPEILHGIEMTVTLELEATSVAFRQAIRGTVRATNTGSRRIPIVYFMLRRYLVVLDKKGEPAKVWRHHQGIESQPRLPEWWVRYLMPGEHYEESFIFYGDGGEAPIGARAYHMPVGEYHLGYRDRMDEEIIPLQVKPIPFQVLADEDAYQGPRIRAVKTVGKYLVLFREASLIELVDPTTGIRKGKIEREIMFLGSLLPSSTVCFSQDGRIAAFGSHGSDPVEWDKFFGDDLEITALPLVGEIEPVHRNGGAFVMGFGPGEETLYFSSRRGIIEADVLTGELNRIIPSNIRVPGLAPGGQYAVSMFDRIGRFANGRSTVIGESGFEVIGDGSITTLQMLSIAPPHDIREVEITGRGELPLVTPGLRGAYLNHGQHTGVTYQSYADNEHAVFATGHVSVESESADGTLVAFASPGGPAHEENLDPHDLPTTIEVWDVQTRTKLYEIDGGDEQLRARFVGSPPTLVVLHRDLNSEPKWFKESFRIFDGKTGAFQREVDIAHAVADAP